MGERWLVAAFDNGRADVDTSQPDNVLHQSACGLVVREGGNCLLGYVGIVIYCVRCRVQ